MPFRVRITDRALADVDSVLAWYGQQSASEAGARWHQRLLDKIDTLEQRPERCPFAAESEDLGIELRELLLGTRRRAHRILFVIEDDMKTVLILRIWPAARDRIHPGDLSDPLGG